MCSSLEDVGKTVRVVFHFRCGLSVRFCAQAASRRVSCRHDTGSGNPTKVLVRSMIMYKGKIIQFTSSNSACCPTSNTLVIPRSLPLAHTLTHKSSVRVGTAAPFDLTIRETPGWDRVESEVLLIYAYITAGTYRRQRTVV